MRALDITDELIVHVTDPRHDVNTGAILALNTLWEHHAPECINTVEQFFEHKDGDTLPAGNQIPPEKIARARESLLAAIAALDAAREKHPSGPSGVVPS